MANEGATWVIFDDEGLYSPVGYSGSYVIRIEGDSLHNSHLYKKMWVANLCHDGISRPENINPPYKIDSFSFFGLVRDDSINRRFVGIIPTYQNIGNDEVLIHDFGIDVGQDMLGVYKQDTVTLDSIIVGTFYDKARQAHVSTRKDILTIEGIGTSITGPLCQNPAVAINSGFRSIIDYCIGSNEDCMLEFKTTSTYFSESEYKQFSIYPNPVRTNGQLFINLNETRPGLLQCISINGKVVFEQTIVPGNNNIRIGNLEPGIHMLLFERTLRKIIVL